MTQVQQTKRPNRVILHAVLKVPSPLSQWVSGAWSLLSGQIPAYMGAIRGGDKEHP
jgi:hypothetical protein